MNAVIDTGIRASNGPCGPCDGRTIQLRVSDCLTLEVGLISGDKAIYLYAKHLPKLIDALLQVQAEISANVE